MPLIHGSFYQRRLSLLGRPLTLTLVARRSKRFAGTRYARRGVTEEGHVANDVELEQVVEVDCAAAAHASARSACLSSVVQVRGSVPLFWSQAWDSFSGDAALRPSIRMLHFLDPLFAATSRHFADLRSRFGDPIICLDLLRQSDRRRQESVLSGTYSAAVTFLNKRCPAEQRIRYVSWDMRSHSRSLESNLLGDLQNEQAPLLTATGIFATSPSAVQRAQSGVLRTNCVDCLDRTNVGQFAFGLLALGEQLRALGITMDPLVDARSTLAGELMVTYETTGNALAEQYAGSEAHTGIFQRWRGDWHAGAHSRDLLTTIRRFYSNVVTDEDKQQAINLFLGEFVPLSGSVVRSQSSVLSERNIAAHPEEDSLQRSGSAGLPNTLSSVSLASSTGEAHEYPSLPQVLLSAASSEMLPSSSTSGMLPSGLPSSEGGSLPREIFSTEERGQVDGTRASDRGSIVGRKPRWFSHRKLRQAAAATDQDQDRPMLQSLDQVLPANVRSVRLSAPPVPQPAPQTSWLSPRGLQRSTTSASESGGGISGSGKIGVGSSAAMALPPQRLVRSSSAGDIQSLASTATSPFLSERGAAAGRAVRFPTAAPGPPRETQDISGSSSTRRGAELLGRLILEGHKNSSSTGFATLPSGSGSYHTLAGLNLEGAKLLPAPSVITPRGDNYSATTIQRPSNAHPSFVRRLSFASFANLRQLVMGGNSSGALSSNYGGGSAAASRAPSRVASYAGDLAGAEEGCSGGGGGGGFGGASVGRGFPRSAHQVPPLALESMLQQHQAVAHGIDDLGLPAATAALWLRPADALRVLNEEARAAAAAEVKAAAGAPLMPVEFAELERAAAATLRPTINVAALAVA